MIKIHRDNRVIFWLLIGGFVLNILWSLRLELQAKTTTNLVEIYHANLNSNIDTIQGLKRFVRSAEYMTIETNNGKVSFGINPEGNIIMTAGKNSITLGDLGGDGRNGILNITKGMGKFAYMNQSPDSITLGVNDGSNRPFHLQMGLEEDFAEIRHHDSILRVGKGNLGEGIELGHIKGGTVAIDKEKGVGILADKISIETDKEEGKIELKSLVSLLSIGKGRFGEGVELGVKDSGTLAITKDKGIGLISTKKIKITTGGELEIKAEGDINIQSKNGVVKINGKKIHMNE